MKSITSKFASILSAGLAAAGAMPGFGISKGPTPSKYNVFKGNTAEIASHNAAIDAARPARGASKTKRKKLAAAQRKRINVLANGGEYRGVPYLG